MNTYSTQLYMQRRADIPQPSQKNYTHILTPEQVEFLDNLVVPQKELKRSFFDYADAFTFGKKGKVPKISKGTFRKDWQTVYRLLTSDLLFTALYSSDEASHFYRDNPAFLGIVANWVLTFLLAKQGLPCPRPIRTPIILYGISLASVQSALRPLYWLLRYASIPVAITSDTSAGLSGIASPADLIGRWEDESNTGISFFTLRNCEKETLDKLKMDIAAIGIDFMSTFPLIILVPTAYQNTKTDRYLLEFKLA